MTLFVERNINTNDTATVSEGITINTSTSTTIAVANPDRLFFCVNNNNAANGAWIKLQAASVDNDAKGIFVLSKDSWQMPVDNIYTGEISAVADNTSDDLFYTEY